jgi:DnaK suppressor protein
LFDPSDTVFPKGEEVPVSKPTAKAVAASKTPAKTAATTTAKAAPPKPAAKPAVKPAAKTAAAKPVAAPAPAAKPAPAKPAPATKAAAAPSPKPAAKPSNAPTPSPSAAPVPASNRFTDRFAPAAHAAAPMTPTAAEHPAKPAHKPDPKLANAWKNKAGRDLTEPELLAMPEAEYMNDKQLDFFRARLEQQKSDLLSSAGETTEHLREDTSIVPDPVDRATIEEEHALELRTRDRERKLLKKISQSLSRIDNGEYGYCDETGEPIGLQRLMARPTATLSLEAQQRRELKQKMFGD